MTTNPETSRFEGLPHHTPTNTVYDSTAAWYITRWAVKTALPNSSPRFLDQLLDDLDNLPNFTVYLDTPGFEDTAVAHIFRDGSKAIIAHPLHQETPGALIRLTGAAQAGDTLAIDYGYDPPVASTRKPLEGNRQPRLPSLSMPNARSHAATDLVENVKSTIMLQHPNTDGAINNRRRITPQDAPWFGHPQETPKKPGPLHPNPVAQDMINTFQKASRNSDHALHWQASDLMTAILARPVRYVIEAFIPTGPRWFGSNGVELHPLVRAVGLTQSAELKHLETLLKQALYRRDTITTHRCLRHLHLLSDWAQWTTANFCREHQVTQPNESPTNNEIAQAQELNATAGTAFAQDMYNSFPDLAKHFEYAIDPSNRTEQPWATTVFDPQPVQNIFDTWHRTTQTPTEDPEVPARALTPAQQGHLATDLVNLMTHRASIECRNILDPQQRTEHGLPDIQMAPTGETIDPQSQYPIQRIVAQHVLERLSAARQHLRQALMSHNSSDFLEHAARIPQAHQDLSMLLTAMELPNELPSSAQQELPGLLQRRTQTLAQTLARDIRQKSDNKDDSNQPKEASPEYLEHQQQVQDEFLERLMTGDQRRLQQFLRVNPDRFQQQVDALMETHPKPRPQMAPAYTFTISEQHQDLSPVRSQNPVKASPSTLERSATAQAASTHQEETQRPQATNQALPNLIAMNQEEWRNPTWARDHISPGFHAASSSSDPDAQETPSQYTFYIRPSTAVYQFTGQHDADGRPIYRLEYHDPRSGHPDHK